MERSAHNMKGVAPERRQGTDILPIVRYDKVAEAMGCHGEYVESMDDLRPALERSIASGKPAVVHVEVDPEVNAHAIGYEQFQYSRTL